MWIFLVLGIPFLALALAGARRLVEPALGVLSLAAFFGCLLAAVVMGYQSRRLALEERQRSATSSMLVIMAGMLKDEDQASLERIAAQGGPAGTAASLILENRRSAGPVASSPGSSP